ncbi:MAG: bifunctional 3-demethylubiquinone-8 3-O-methyltransferase and 2-octaprenyl-6-hydroxyphenol methylase [Sodalis sp. Fse]|nr:MAG: bifunctional 3-demethylubiquinone-8 3-O-methyltransferase and 2-octaprenyl-6-hydroxyphenol methylase [Sodalis sp. Fse]UVK78809.1 MAG: bifunctional 3-demethylubiquinone-8 3-O-methyltransferase and 2-octaprenyl-6-hydroxyphenol methylase [Sodalis sp. Ffu]
MNPEIGRGTAPQQNNVDPDEIAKFDDNTTLWWNLDGKFKPLHRINPLRLDYILDRAGGLFGKKVLDVGCGGGILTESMAREGAKVTGLDMSSKSLAVARMHALKSGFIINYIQQTIEKHAQFHPNTYDVVTSMEILEHVPDPSSIVRATARLVKPGGEVFFSTLNRNLKAWLLAIIGAEYLLRIVPRGTHDINKFIKPAELLNWMDATPLREQHIIGLHYNPLKDRFSLGGNVDVNYMLHTRHVK